MFKIEEKCWICGREFKIEFETIKAAIYGFRLDKKGIVETEEGLKFGRYWDFYIRSLDIYLHDEDGKFV